MPVPSHGHLATRGRDNRHSAVPSSSLFLEQTLLPSTLPETWTRPVLRAGEGGRVEGAGGGGGCKTHHYRYRPPLLRLFQDSMSVSPYFAPKHTSATQHNSRTKNARVGTCPSSHQYLIDTLTYSHSSAHCLSNYSRKNNDANSKQKSSCWHLLSLRRRGKAWLWRALQGRSSFRQDFDPFGRHQTSKSSSTCNFRSLSANLMWFWPCIVVNMWK